MKQVKEKIVLILCIVLITLIVPSMEVKAVDNSKQSVFTDYEPSINETINELSGLKHPSVSVNKQQLENVRLQIKNGVDPWISYFEEMLNNNSSSKNYLIKNQSTLDETKAKYSYKDYSASFMENIISADATAAYYQALLYYFTGDEEYRRKSITIIRLWSQLDPSEATNVTDGRIKMAWPMYYMISAAEILKYTSCESEDLIWTEEDNNKFINNFIKPPLKYYIANDDSVNYWLNQYNFALLGRISADIFMDDIDDYEMAVEMATVNSRAIDQEGTGSLSRVIRKVNENIEGLDDSVIQIVEMGRDQPHAMTNLMNLTEIAYIFEAQGTKVDSVTGELSTNSEAVSMFNFLDNRLLRGWNYYLKYNMGYETQWYPIANYDVIYDQGRGRIYDTSVYYYYKHNLETKDLMEDENIGLYLTEFQSISQTLDVSDVKPNSWIRIPMEEEDSVIENRNSSIYEVEDKYTLLNGTAVKENCDNIEYLKVVANEQGSSIALLGLPTQGDRSGYSTITLRIKTNSNTKLELMRDNGLDAFKTVILPDTNGEWSDFSINMNINEVSYSDYSQDIQILFLKVIGNEGDFVCIDNLRVNQTDNYSPEFEENITKKVINTYINSNLSLSFKATDSDILTYSIKDEPTNSAMDSITGDFIWNPTESGIYKFYVQANDSKATSVLEVEVNVLPTIDEALQAILKSFDSNEKYTSSTKKIYDDAYNKIIELMENNEDDEYILNSSLNNLQNAINNLEVLTPLLRDGTMDYSNIITSSLDQLREKNLVDEDTETFTGDLISPNNYFVLDFGKDYSVTVDSFKIQARKYFPGRVWRAKVYGSNDGVNWTKLTNSEVGNAEKMVEISVEEKYKSTNFRYLKIACETKCVNVAEFRIIGERHETTNKITSVSIESNNIDSTRAVPGDKIKLTFTTKETINNINVVINNQIADVNNIEDLKYEAEIIVDDIVTIGTAKFSINYNTIDGKQGLVADEVTDESNVLLSEESSLINLLDGDIDFIDSTSNRLMWQTIKQIEYLTDGNKNTCSDFRLNNTGYGSFIIFDFKDRAVKLSRIEVLARQDGYFGRIEGTEVLASNDGESWERISIGTALAIKNWQVLEVNNGNSYRYIKISNPNGWFGNMAELKLMGEREEVVEEQ